MAKQATSFIGLCEDPLTPPARQRERYAARARVLKALAHPTRLLLVDELRQDERCVCELQRIVGADMSTVSKHLALLRDAGIVTDERRGNMVFYALRACCVPEFLECLEMLVWQNVERQIATWGGPSRRRLASRR